VSQQTQQSYCLNLFKSTGKKRW